MTLRLAMLLLVLLLMAACGDDGDEAKGPDRGEVGAVAAGGETSPDDGAVGAMGDELLSADIVEVQVEVDRSSADVIAADPVAVLREELREHGGKTVLHDVAASMVAAQEIYTLEDLAALSDRHRASRSIPDAPAIYVLVLDGRYEEESVTGVAFSATSFAVFPDQIGGGLLGTNREAFERAVLVHELGHLFGLVDLTGHGAFHEDPEHPGHARSQGSVMHWAIEDVSIRNLFRGGPPVEFDDADRREMQLIRRP